MKSMVIIWCAYFCSRLCKIKPDYGTIAVGKRVVSNGPILQAIISASRNKTAVHYHIQESYWRGRMAFYLIGLDDDDDDDELPQEDKQINREHLCLETEKLDATTDTFKTRHRAVRILTEIKEKLLMVLREGQSLSLPEVIDEVQHEAVREYWDLYGEEVLNPKDRWGTTKEMLRSLVDAGFIESSFWKLQDNPPQY